MSGHTPGPWRSDWDHGVIRAPDESHIARMPAWTRSSKYGEANARLIAAAPELLTACRLALGAFEQNNAIDWHVIERAINKAEGR